jgi:hypothetical protein
MADIMDPVQYPFRDQNWVTKFLYSFIAIIPIFGTFILLGYNMKVIRENAREPKENLPEWDDFVKLFTDGFMTFLVIIFYIGIPFILIMLSLLPMVIGMCGMASDNEAVQILGSLGPVMTIVLVVAGYGLLLIAALFLPMATGIYAVTGNIFEAINVFGVIGKILSNIGSYAMVIIIPFVIGIVFAIVASILNFIPFLGTVVLLIINFPYCLYIGIVSGRLIGNMFREQNLYS